MVWFFMSSLGFILAYLDLSYYLKDFAQHIKNGFVNVYNVTL